MSKNKTQNLLEQIVGHEALNPPQSTADYPAVDKVTRETIAEWEKLKDRQSQLIEAKAVCAPNSVG